MILKLLSFASILLFTKSIQQLISVPRTKQQRQLAHPLLQLLIRMIHNLCCPKTPCATKKTNSNEQGFTAKVTPLSPWGEELPYEKDGGGVVENSKTLRGTNILFCGSDLKFCHIFFYRYVP